MPHLATLALLAATSTIAISQTPDWQTAAGGKFSFEVASVRPSNPNAPTNINFDFDYTDYFSYSGGLITANLPLLDYLIFAYKIPLTNETQAATLIAQLPKWAETEQFTIEARPQGTPTKDQLRLMMQSLLTDRFKLAVHTETRQLPIYALQLDKPATPGPQLKPHTTAPLCIADPSQPEPTRQQIIDHHPSCGESFWGVNNQMHIRLMDLTMAQIAMSLSPLAPFMGGLDRRPVLDQTGLPGRYNLNFEFLRDSPTPPPEASGPTFTQALKQQAGLKLVKQTGPVQILVIDHLERPTEN
jgi:bla regulator protein blaR1